MKIIMKNNDDSNLIDFVNNKMLLSLLNVKNKLIF